MNKNSILVILSALICLIIEFLIFNIKLNHYKSKLQDTQTQLELLTTKSLEVVKLIKKKDSIVTPLIVKSYVLKTKYSQTTDPILITDMDSILRVLSAHSE